MSQTPLDKITSLLSNTPKEDLVVIRQRINAILVSHLGKWSKISPPPDLNDDTALIAYLRSISMTPPIVIPEPEPDPVPFASLVVAWRRCFGNRIVRVGDLITKSGEDLGLRSALEHYDPELNHSKVGTALAKLRDKIVLAEADGGAREFRLNGRSSPNNAVRWFVDFHKVRLPETIRP